MLCQSIQWILHIHVPQLHTGLHAHSIWSQSKVCIILYTINSWWLVVVHWSHHPHASIPAFGSVHVHTTSHGAGLQQGSRIIQCGVRARAKYYGEVCFRLCHACQLLMHLSVHCPSVRHSPHCPALSPLLVAQSTPHALEEDQMYIELNYLLNRCTLSLWLVYEVPFLLSLSLSPSFSLHEAHVSTIHSRRCGSPNQNAWNAIQHAMHLNGCLYYCHGPVVSYRQWHHHSIGGKPRTHGHSQPQTQQYCNEYIGYTCMIFTAVPMCQVSSS